MATLTDRAIQSAKATTKDLWISDGGARGAGRLYVRVQPSGWKGFYYRCTGPDGERQTIPLGEYSQKGAGAALSLTQAREKAGELERLYRDGNKDLRGYLEAERKARERELQEAEERAREAEESAKRGSLRKLLDAYIAHLERTGRSDINGPRGLFKNHVINAFPDLVERKASDIRPKDLRPVLAKLIDADKGRTAGKLRSYMRAAYSAAIRAEHDPTLGEAMLGFGIEANPCDALPALAQFSKVGERTLTDDELRLYMAGIEEYPVLTRCAMRLALYLGGQRPWQLVRVAPGDVDVSGDDVGVIRLRDAKGARKAARLHVLPLVGVARDTVKELLEINGKSEYLFSSYKDTHLHGETMSKAAADISEGLVKGERILSGFQLRDIRRTCETMLARMGISKDVRAQLLSHGLGGVQDRHYDRHSYWEEKRAALLAWNDKLEAIKAAKPAPTNVVELEKARAA